MIGGGRLRLAVLISGRGSNLVALAHACAESRVMADIALVLSDRADAAGLMRAQEFGLATRFVDPRSYPGREAFDQALVEAILGAQADLVVLAGFMRILSAPFVRRFAGRLINIHPSLLPNYKGLHTHRRVLEGRESEHGVSVHFVTEQLDGGPVICQVRLPVRPDDTEQTLSARVQLEEHRIYPMVIGWLAAGRLRLRGTIVEFDSAPLLQPLPGDEHHA